MIEKTFRMLESVLISLDLGDLCTESGVIGR
jgi:hypothetical protein